MPLLGGAEMINPAEIRAIVAKWQRQGLVSVEQAKQVEVKERLSVANCKECGASFKPRTSRNIRCSAACIRKARLESKRATAKRWHIKRRLQNR